MFNWSGGSEKKEIKSHQGKGARRLEREQLLERLIYGEQRNDSLASSNQTLVSQGWQSRSRVCVCLHSKFSEEKKKKKKEKKTEVVRGSKRKPAMLCCAVRCHCEFDDLSHLRVAIRITEDTEGEAKHGVSLSVNFICFLISLGLKL